MLKHPNISHNRCYETDKEGASSFLLIGLVASNSHVHASIWCFFVSTAPSTSVLRWSPSTTWRYRSERVFICRCMSSWISVAEMKPPVARKTVNTHVVLFLPIFWHPDLNRCMEQMLKAHMSAVVAIVLTFQAADLWDTPVIRFFCRCWVPWSIHPFEFRRCSAQRSSLYKLFQPRPQLTKDSHLAARIPFPSTSIFAPSMSPNEKQAAKVLSPAMTTPTWTRDPKIDIGVAAA